MEKNKNKGINVFQKYLTLWVLFCMIVGILMGKYISIVPSALGKRQIESIYESTAIFGIGLLVILFLVNIANNTKRLFLEIKESKYYGG